VDSLSCGTRMIMPEEAVADRRESPHHASLSDVAVNHTDILPVAEVLAGLAAMPAD
jgi:maleamate amidohydrolase